jgi:hypothetical protein
LSDEVGLDTDTGYHVKGDATSADVARTRWRKAIGRVETTGF